MLLKPWGCSVESVLLAPWISWVGLGLQILLMDTLTSVQFVSKHGAHPNSNVTVL